MQDLKTLHPEIPRTSIFTSPGASSKGLAFTIIESRYGAILIPILIACFFSAKETVSFYLPRLTIDSSMLPIDILLGLIGTVGVLYAVGSTVSIAVLGVRGMLEKNEAHALFIYSIGVLIIIAQPALYSWDLPNTGLHFYHNALLPVLFFIACIVGPYLKRAKTVSH